MESDLYIAVDTKAKTYTTYEKYGYTAEYPIYHYQKETEPKETINGINRIALYAGPKG